MAAATGNREVFDSLDFKPILVWGRREQIVQVVKDDNAGRDCRGTDLARSAPRSLSLDCPSAAPPRSSLLKKLLKRDSEMVEFSG
jgi:hypothetical protein